MDSEDRRGRAIHLKTSRVKLLTILGCLFIISGVGFLVMGSYTASAQSDQPQYVGSSQCASCHRSLSQSHAKSNHALTLQDAQKKKNAVLGDFSQGEDVRQVLLPGVDTARAFTAKDIAFVVGAGQHVQRYLFKVGANDYMVLPAEWNVETKSWQRLQLADQWPDPAYDWEQNCAYCHTTGFDVERSRWKDAGVQCEACHGPASNHVRLAKDAGGNPSDEELIAIRSAIFTAPDPQVCGQCHSQGVGKDNHPYPVGYTPGSKLDDYFQLVPKDSADHWWTSGHARQQNMQYNEWLNSAHALSLADMLKSKQSADQCLNCHSQDFRRTADLIAAIAKGDRKGQPPDALTLTTAQWGVTCQTCHYPHTDSKQPFDLVEEANQLCVSCHTNPEGSNGIHHPVKEMFEGVALVPGIDSTAGDHFKAENGPRCVTCHMPDVPVGTTSRASHTFKPILPGKSDDKLPSACAGCHKDLSTTDLLYLVEDTQQTVRSRLAIALARLGTIPQPKPDTDELTRYQQASAALTFVQNDGSLGIHNYAYTDALLTAAERDLSLLSVSGGNLSPTEAPAPTATPVGGIIIQSAVGGETVASGVRPMTIIVIGIIIGILLIATVAFFRRSGA
jgi:predicted CXXCH cytochrome family protein